MCRRGITRACPGVAGLMSMKAIVCSSVSRISAGASPAAIAQKMQSGFGSASPLTASTLLDGERV